MATNLDQVAELVREGKHTREEILDKVGCTVAGLASYLNTMRNAARFSPGAEICPIEKDKIFTVGTYAEFTAMKAERVAKKPAAAKLKSPEQLHAEATKRVEKCNQAVARYADKDGEEAELRHSVAVAELALAEYLLEQLPEPAEVDAPVEDELL